MRQKGLGVSGAQIVLKTVKWPKFLIYGHHVILKWPVYLDTVLDFYEDGLKSLRKFERNEIWKLLRWLTLYLIITCLLGRDILGTFIA